METTTPKLRSTQTNLSIVKTDHATIADRARDFHKRLFLEAWYLQRDSIKMSNTGNEHIDIPDVYKSLA